MDWWSEGVKSHGELFLSKHRYPCSQILNGSDSIYAYFFDFLINVFLCFFCIFFFCFLLYFSFFFFFICSYFLFFKNAQTVRVEVFLLAIWPPSSIHHMKWTEIHSTKIQSSINAKEEWGILFMFVKQKKL